jgi:protein SCO1/2
MGPTQKKIAIGLWILALVAIVGVVTGTIKISMPRTPVNGSEHADSSPSQVPVPLTDLFPAPPLTLTDQNGESFSTASLKGNVWVADFIFTSCGSICPILSDRMAHLQQMTPIGVNFVSFSVDPKTDTPAVLKAYGTRIGADFSRWHFLTGSPEQMGDAAIQMKIATSTSNPLSHSDRFILINAKGMVVGLYSGLEATDLKQIVLDATKLASEAPQPQTAPAGKSE